MIHYQYFSHWNILSLSFMTAYHRQKDIIIYDRYLIFRDRLSTSLIDIIIYDRYLIFNDRLSASLIDIIIYE